MRSPGHAIEHIMNNPWLMAGEFDNGRTTLVIAFPAAMCGLSDLLHGPERAAEYRLATARYIRCWKGRIIVLDDDANATLASQWPAGEMAIWNALSRAGNAGILSRRIDWTNRGRSIDALREGLAGVRAVSPGRITLLASWCVERTGETVEARSLDLREYGVPLSRRNPAGDPRDVRQAAHQKSEEGN